MNVSVHSHLVKEVPPLPVGRTVLYDTAGQSPRPRPRPRPGPRPNPGPRPAPAPRPRPRPRPQPMPRPGDTSLLASVSALLGVLMSARFPQRPNPRPVRGPSPIGPFLSSPGMTHLVGSGLGFIDSTMASPSPSPSRVATTATTSASSTASSKFAGNRFDHAALDPDRPTVGQGGRCLATSLGQDAAGGGAGDIHRRTHLLVGVALEVGQPQGFEFVQAQGDLLQVTHGHAGRLEMDGCRIVAYGARFRRSRQYGILLFDFR